MPIYNIVVFVETTGDTVIRPVHAESPLAARKAFLREMTKAESIVRIEEA